MALGARAMRGSTCGSTIEQPFPKRSASAARDHILCTINVTTTVLEGVLPAIKHMITPLLP